MEFTQIDIDGSVDDLSEEELRETVSEFSEAQESNKKTFAEVKETVSEIEDIDVSVEEAQEYKESLVEDVEEHSPLAESELQDFNISRLRELEAEFSEVEEGDEGEDEGDEQEFSDVGKQGKTNADDEENFSSLRDRVDSISGLELN